MAKKTVEQIKAEIDAREKAKAEASRRRGPTGAAATPAKYNKAAMNKVIRATNYSQYQMTGSRGHGSQFQNPRAYRLGEEIILDYLLNEGFASDENSALSIMNAMSEEWMYGILEYTNWNTGTLRGSGMSPRDTANARRQSVLAKTNLAALTPAIEVHKSKDPEKPDSHSREENPKLRGLLGRMERGDRARNGHGY